MPRDESDSSDEEGSLYTITDVTLGYASKEPTDDPFSQLGGLPTWPDPTSIPSKELGKCSICQNMMGLLLQLNGDLPERFAGHERRLYIFSCRSKACRKKAGSVRAMRGIKISKSTSRALQQDGTAKALETPRPGAQPSANLENNIFNPKSPPTTNPSQNPFTSPAPPPPNPFSNLNPPPQRPQNVEYHRPLANPFAPHSSEGVHSPFTPSPNSTPNPTLPNLSTTFAEKASISTAPHPPQPKLPWPPTSSLPPPYPAYSIDADYESLEPTPIPGRNAIHPDPSEPAPNDNEKETFESNLDKSFQRFADRLTQNPLQILRYEFAGSPLLYSKSDNVGQIFSTPASAPTNNTTHISITPQPGRGSKMPHCPNCSAPRVFEVQLVPHAIAELEVEEEGMDGMEWGTVILGVCGSDCGERGIEAGRWGWVEEWVGVQWEEEGGRGVGVVR